MCELGQQLQENASSADRRFKSMLVDFFSRSPKNEADRVELERLGVTQREADEALNRHSRLCPACADALREISVKK